MHRHSQMHHDIERHKASKMLRKAQSEENKVRGIVFSFSTLAVLASLYYQYPDSPLLLGFFALVLIILTTLAFSKINQWLKWSFSFLCQSIIVVGLVSVILFLMSM